MKNFSKLAMIFGGTALLVGCGQTELVSGQADAVATSNSAISFNTNTAQETDKLVGYYSGCQGPEEGAPWEIMFGDGAGATSFKITKGDANCQLWATGVIAQDQKNGAGVKDTNDAPVVSQYGFYSPTDTSSPSPILIKTNTIANPWTAANVALARKLVDDNGTLKLVQTADQASTMMNVGAVNVDGATEVTGPLRFDFNFKIRTIAGSAADLSNSSRLAKFIGYSSLSGLTSENYAAPNYVQGVTDAEIRTDGLDRVILSDKYFRFAKAAASPVAGNEYTFGQPGDFIKDNANVRVTKDTFLALTDLQRYDVLRKAYETAAGNYGVQSLNPSATTIAIPSATLYPIGTNLGATSPENRDNVIFISRKDALSGVRSFQAILLTLKYCGADADASCSM
jgi:hypothetical protein